ncbi:hypothetical protein AXX17_AT2G05460 [Arabidopsis thaliana]|uniref:Uncharacterized protein n=1 Tax=Arabidopsis thaliana TaxID=3702 RepID=A0A178VVZ8_ARATH|nr:hypothetical protein AXX17_AT2G05460 [Arabidopsis thaliana]
MKFVGCYEFASQTPRSGETEDDILCETKLSAKKKAKLSSVEEESLKRPISVKAAKALAKSKVKGKSEGGADAGSGD